MGDGCGGSMVAGEKRGVGISRKMRALAAGFTVHFSIIDCDSTNLRGAT